MVVSSITNLFSGASTINPTPYMVSNLVVKTFIFWPFSVSKITVAPFDFPIQFFCCSLSELEKSTLSKPFKSLSAYAEILKLH